RHLTATYKMNLPPLHDALPIFGGDSGRSRVTDHGDIGHRHGSQPSWPETRPPRTGPVGGHGHDERPRGVGLDPGRGLALEAPVVDRKSTRLNSSHVKISYAVFC